MMLSILNGSRQAKLLISMWKSGSGEKEPKLLVIISVKQLTPFKR